MARQTCTHRWPNLAHSKKQFLREDALPLSKEGLSERESGEQHINGDLHDIAKISAPRCWRRQIPDYPPRRRCCSGEVISPVRDDTPDLACMAALGQLPITRDDHVSVLRAVGRAG